MLVQLGRSGEAEGDLTRRPLSVELKIMTATAHAIARPETSEYDPYFHDYVELVTESDVLSGLTDQLEEFGRVVEAVPIGQAEVVHAPYGWTIKQVIGHLNDVERVLGYRLFRFAVGDSTQLPGFDQDHYTDQTDYSQATLDGLFQEFCHLRRANAAMIARLPEAAYVRMGNADGRSISVRAIIYVLLGHTRHHSRIIASRVENV